MAEVKRFCEKDGKIFNQEEFYQTTNLEKYPDGYLNMCKKCLTMHVDNFDPKTFTWILQEIDVPYIPDEWNKLLARYGRDRSRLTGTTILGRYLAKMKLKQYKDFRWADNKFLQELADSKVRETMERQGYSAAQITEVINTNSLTIPDGDVEIPEYDDPPPLQAGNPATYRDYTNVMQESQPQPVVQQNPIPDFSGGQQNSNLFIPPNVQAPIPAPVQQQVPSSDYVDPFGGVSLVNGDFFPQFNPNDAGSLFMPVGGDIQSGYEDSEDEELELTDDDRKYLRLKWGKAYRPFEWVQLEQLYKEMTDSYDIQSAGDKNTLLLMCKTSLKANQLIDLGDVDGAQKMAKQYNELMKSGKWTAAQNKTAENELVDSIGELVALCEKDGFIPRFYTEAPQDKVDRVIQDMQIFTRQLVTEELGLGNLIENSIKNLEKEKESIEAAANADDASVTEEDRIFDYDHAESVLSLEDYKEFNDFEEDWEEEAQDVYKDQGGI